VSGQGYFKDGELSDEQKEEIVSKFSSGDASELFRRLRARAYKDRIEEGEVSRPAICFMLRDHPDFQEHYESAAEMQLFGTSILKFTKRELIAFIGWLNEQNRFSKGTIDLYREG